MSYDISLKQGGEVVRVPDHEEGGTFQLGGSVEGHLNITYNYAPFYVEFLDSEKGIRWLYGKKAKDCIARLERAVDALGTEKYIAPDEADHEYPAPDDPNLVRVVGKAYARKHGGYWEATAGNAGAALATLLEWARLHPEAKFSGD